MSFSTTSKISEAEWEIMKVIWEKSPITFTEIREKVQPLHNWKENTIHTLLTRLVKKEILEVTEVKPVKKYAPLVNENECAILETESLLDKVYNGALDKLVKGFIENKKISKEDIKQLKEILEKAESED